jgi:spermidine synthase
MTIELQVLEEIASKNTGYQFAEVLDTENFGRVLMLDGIIQLGFSDEYIYHECLVHPPMLMQPEARSVAIVGGGDGGALEEVLKHKQLERAVLVDLDEAVIQLSREHLSEMSKGAFDDPRSDLVLSDGRAYLDQRPGTFDVLLLDLTDATGPSRSLYTREFYNTAAASLKPGGVVGLQCDSPVVAPEAFGTILRTAREVFPVVRPYLAFIPSFGVLCGFAVLSRDSDPAAVAAATWRRRMEQLKPNDLRYLTPEVLSALWALPGTYRRVIDEGDSISTDSDPFEIELP